MAIDLKSSMDRFIVLKFFNTQFTVLFKIQYG